MNSKGVTLIEVIAVLAIIGILAVVVLPKIDFGSTSSRASVYGAAYMVASDIRYAQECAMANRVSKTVYLLGQSSYAFPDYYFQPPLMGWILQVDYHRG